jgi:hypothetical protein
MVYSYYKIYLQNVSCMFISLCVLMKFYNVHRFKRRASTKKNILEIVTALFRPKKNKRRKPKIAQACPHTITQGTARLNYYILSKHPRNFFLLCSTPTQ